MKESPNNSHKKCPKIHLPEPFQPKLVRLFSVFVDYAQEQQHLGEGNFVARYQVLGLETLACIRCNSMFLFLDLTEYSCDLSLSRGNRTPRFWELKYRHITAL